jgi:hypothetical protein
MDFLTNIGESVKQAYGKAKEAVQGPVQKAVDTTGLSNVNVTNVAPETPGTTTTGGKRGSRRTRRSKKSKKTHRRRKH